MNGFDDVFAGHGDKFYFLGAEDELNIYEKLLAEDFRDCDENEAACFRDR